MRPMEEYQLIFYEKENGEKPAAEFIRSTEKKMAARIVTDLKLLALEGPTAREPLSKHLEDGIFELRSKQGSNIARVLYFFVVGKKIIVTNGFIKKTMKTPEAEKDKAKRYRADYLRRYGA